MPTLATLLRRHLVPRTTLLAAIGLLALRLTVGYGLFESGSGKFDALATVCDDDGTAPAGLDTCTAVDESPIGWFETLTVFGSDTHLPGGGRLNFQAAAFNEFFFGLLLMLGLGSRLVALPLMATMAVAMATAHWETVSLELGFVSETAFVYLVMLAVVAAAGPGRLSLDGLAVWLWRRDGDRDHAPNDVNLRATPHVGVV